MGCRGYDLGEKGEFLMESFDVLVIPAVLAVLLVQMLAAPVRWLWKAAAHSLCGFLCLWLLRSVSFATGVLIPLNAVTVAAAGFLGLPGIALCALLEIL